MDLLLPILSGDIMMGLGIIIIGTEGIIDQFIDLIMVGKGIAFVERGEMSSIAKKCNKC